MPIRARAGPLVCPEVVQSHGDRRDGLRGGESEDQAVSPPPQPRHPALPPHTGPHRAPPRLEGEVVEVEGEIRPVTGDHQQLLGPPARLEASGLTCGGYLINLTNVLCALKNGICDIERAPEWKMGF